MRNCLDTSMTKATLWGARIAMMCSLATKTTKTP